LESTTDDTRTSKVPLPEGTISVGIGLLIAGVASYAFFIVGKWALGGDEQFAPVSALWFATFALAPGFFIPLEQELGRALAHRRALGQGSKPVVQRVLTIGAIMATVVAVAVLIASPVITSGFFDGDWVLLVALVVAFVAYAPAHLARGVASGSGRFRAYAIVMGADGVVRIALCLLLAVVGVKTAGPYGFAVALAPLAGVGFVLWRGDLRTDDGPPATWQEVTPNLGWLLLGSVFSAALVNAGPIATNLLAGKDQKELVSQFAYGVLLARVPLFLFQAVQAALLPRLSRLAARNELDEFRSGFKKLMKIVVAVGVIGTLGAVALGPTLVKLVYDATLSRRTLGMLAFSSGLYMVALAMAQAVIALKGHALVALGWAVGVLAFLVGIGLGGDQVFRRVEIGLVASSIGSAIVFFVALRSRLRAGATPDPQSVMEAIVDMPFEA
jgi:O-antigen/teichoic acid export membrane protein